MYTFSEIKKILDNCNSWEDIIEVTGIFRFLIENDWVKSTQLYNAMVELSDQAFRRIENL